LGLGNVGFIKIDVEGHEQDVLTGLSGLLEASRPNILVEIGGAQRGGSLSEVRHLLGPLGYIGLRLNERGMVVVVPRDLEITESVNVILIADRYCKEPITSDQRIAFQSRWRGSRKLSGQGSGR
jgi:hypothetical protein